MAYVVRDSEGRIRAVFEDPVQGAQEVAADDPALVDFVTRNARPGQLLDDEWVRSDLEIARVTEDLIDILMDKGLISFIDFPEGAQKKLMNRRGRRKELDYMESLFGEMALPDDGDGTDNGYF